MPIIKTRYYFLLVIAAVATIFMSGTFDVHAQVETPDFRIVDVRAEYGQMVVEVQHFNPDGSHWHFEHYTFQGREEYKKPRITDASERLFLSDSREAPKRTNALGDLRYYLPEGMSWLRSSSPHLGTDSIFSVIQSIHDKRLKTGHTRGARRLTTTPLNFSASDTAGVSGLVARFTSLIDNAYTVKPGGADYVGRLKPTTIPMGREHGTVSTFYSDSGTGGDSVDGRVGYSGSVTWATIRGAATGTFAEPSEAAASTQIYADTATNKWGLLSRFFFLFDTSALPDGDTIDSADFQFVNTARVDNFSQSLSFITTTPASDNTLVTADYDQVGTTKQATDVTIASLTVDSATFNTMALNATGLASISLTGVSKFGARLSADIANVEPTWVSGNTSLITFATSDETLPGDKRPKLVVTHTAPPAAAISGTVGDGATEQEVRDGGGTIIITLTGTTWVADGATFNAQRQNIINGLDAADAQTNGWNAEVRDEIGVSSVVRTSGTIATITIAAADVIAYQITTNESITVTVPSTAVALGSPLTASPTITITAGTESAAITGTISDGATSPQVQAGDETAIVTLTNTKWVADGATFNAQRQNIIDGFVSASSETNGWNNRRSDFAVTDVVRTSDIIVTVTFSASSAYAISAAETITLTVPATAIGGSALTATPTFVIAPNFVSTGTWISPAIDLSSITDIAYCAVGWSESIPAGTSAAVEYSSDGGGAYSTATNGSCPFTIASSLAAVSDFRIKVTLLTTDATVTPTITALGFIAGTTAGQTVRYQLITTPALTATDRTGNGYSGTMSFPALPSGVSTTVGSMTALRAPPSAQTARGVPQITSPVSGAAVSANIFNTDETGWTGLPGYQLVNTMATAGDGLPVQFIWYIMLGLVTIMLGFFALNLTQSLFAAGVAMALGLGASIAMGGGLIPGWVIFVFIPVAIGMIFLRPRLAI